MENTNGHDVISEILVSTVLIKLRRTTALAQYIREHV